MQNYDILTILTSSSREMCTGCTDPTLFSKSGKALRKDFYFRNRKFLVEIRDAVMIDPLGRNLCNNNNIIIYCT